MGVSSNDTDSIVIDYDQQYSFEKYTAGSRFVSPFKA